eukprot:7384834-Prymnesium_polylepis.1
MAVAPIGRICSPGAPSVVSGLRAITALPRAREGRRRSGFELSAELSPCPRPVSSGRVAPAGEPVFDMDSGPNARCHACVTRQACVPQAPWPLRAPRPPIWLQKGRSFFFVLLLRIGAYYGSACRNGGVGQPGNNRLELLTVVGGEEHSLKPYY